MLIDRVRKAIDRYGLLEKGDRLIVGVSGGVDSMVLLRVLNAYREEYNLFFIVAHVNHGLRPFESEKEAELVQRESLRLGFLFEYGQFNVKEFCKVKRLSIQEGARRLRFHFFKDLLLKHNAQKVALGHNADDQVETVLLRLLRGSGLKGLKGMLPIREGKVIRPLLEEWRGDIESFATQNGVPFLLDSSNLKEVYLRNRIRRVLIPLIEKEYQQNFKKIVTKTSVILREEDEYLEREAEETFRRISREEREGLYFKLSEYDSLHKAIQWRVLYKMIGELYKAEMVFEDVRESEVSLIFKRLLQSTPSFLFKLSGGAYIEKQYDKVSLRRGRMKTVPPFEAEIALPGGTFIKEIGSEVIIEETVRDKITEDLKRSLTTAFVDCENIQWPLRMRNFRPGDRFQPLGSKGQQKVKEFFIDHKVPRFERVKVPLLVSGQMIIWVVGYRIDERVKVTDKTQKVLKIEVVPSLGKT